MTYGFIANKVEADELQRFLGFADDGHYFWMQPDDESGLSPSSDAANVWIEIHDQQFGGRGGIEQVTLSRQGLIISLTPSKAMKMGRHEQISVQFSVTDREFERIRAVLLSVMRGSENLVAVFA